MKKILLLFAAMCCMMVANAQQFTDANGIKYNVTSTENKTVEVIMRGDVIGVDSYEGNIEIPATVANSSVTYNVTSIGESAFENCENLGSVTLPEGLESIGISAFEGCSNLASINIPSSVTEIGEYAFSNCEKFSSVTLPDGLKTIGEGAFYYCEKLASITIPSSVTSIGECAFGDCPLLASISVDAGNTVYDSRNNCNAIIETATNTLISGCSNTVIPSTVTAIGDYAFYYCENLSSVTLPNGLKTIGYCAFEYCAFTSINLPSSLESIDDYAFYECNELASIIIPGKVTSIGDGTFEYCENLVSVTLPNGLKSIGDDAFGYCEKLVSITLPDGLESIDEDAFEYCSNLESINIPSSVTEIGKYAFYHCDKLSSVTVKWTEAEKIPDIIDYVFRDVDLSNATLYVPGNTTALYQAKNVWKEFTNIVEWKNFTITKTDDTTIKQQVADGGEVAIDERNRDIKSLEVLEEVENVSVTYTRNFANAGKWQAWYVPFDVDVADMAQAGLDVAEIYGILLDKDNNAVIAFLKMDAGTVKANTPYVVRPKEYSDVTVTTTSTLYQTNATQFAISSAKDTYTIGGIYERTTTPGNWYAVNTDGQFQKMGTGVNLSPMRIWMTIDPRDDNPYTQPSEANAKMNIMVIGDDETTGIESLTPTLSEGTGVTYDLQGQRVNSIQKGQLYIMNGKKYVAK